MHVRRDEHRLAGERAGKTKRKPAVGPHEGARWGESRRKGSHGTPAARPPLRGYPLASVCAVRGLVVWVPFCGARVPFLGVGGGLVMRGTDFGVWGSFSVLGPLFFSPGPFAQAGVPLCVSGGSPFGGLARPAGVPLRVASRGPSRGGGVGGESRPVRGSAPTGAPNAHSGGVPGRRRVRKRLTGDVSGFPPAAAGPAQRPRTRRPDGLSW